MNGIEGVRQAMSLNRGSIATFLGELATWPPFVATGLSLQPLDEAAFTNTEGWVIWRWNAPDQELRGKGTYLYADGDGTSLFLTLAGAARRLAEIEIWRGDGREPLKAPTVGALTIPKPGVVYGPGGIENT
jgi:hypothetical protein